MRGTNIILKPEVQNKGTCGPTKRTFFKKKYESSPKSCERCVPGLTWVDVAVHVVPAGHGESERLDSWRQVLRVDYLLKKPFND